MVSDDVLRALRPMGRETKAGWIFPDGSVVPCRVMHHRDVLPVEYRNRYDVLLEEYDQMMWEHLDSLGEDEHPEMHQFNPEEECDETLLGELAGQNFLRFGIVRKNDDLILELSGVKDGVVHHQEVIAYVVAGLSIDRVILCDISTTYHNRTEQKQFR